MQENTIRKTSSIYLSNITCIDHSWCCPSSNYTVQGGSFLASFVVTGDIDDHEQVVVDFSTLKHDIKDIIDSMSSGLDHKLWVFPGAWETFEEQTNGRVKLSNKTVNLSLPKTALAVIPLELEGTYSIKVAENIVRALVQDKLEWKYPSIEVQCMLSDEPDIFQLPNLKSMTQMFNYQHGLKNSTSIACQNICHGHLSYVAFYYTPITWVEQKYKINSELKDLILFIDKAVFVYKENIVKSDQDDILSIEYITKERGLFRADYSTVDNKLIVLPEETTIENLLTNLLKKYGNIRYLKSLGVTHIAMSEGLQKGSLISIESLLRLQ